MDTLYANMDSTKKRKADENGAAFTVSGDGAPGHNLLTPEDCRKILEAFTKDQLLDVLQSAAARHADVLADVRSIADPDTTKRKLFVRGLGPETTTEKLRSTFSAFGEIDEAIAVTDKVTGKSKGFGFITFKHVDGAVVALKEPSKKIDGRMTVAQLKSGGPVGGGADVSLRKVYVGNVPFDISADRLLGHFEPYGEIEEGPLGFDNQSGKPKGFAFFIYKTEEGARAALAEPMKNIDGHQVMCKLAVDGKKGKPEAPNGAPAVSNGPVAPPPNAFPGPMSSGYGGYSGFSGGMMTHQNPPLNSPMLPAAAAGGPGFQPPSSYNGSGHGYGAGSGEYRGPQYGGPGLGEYGGGLSNAGPSMYGLPPSSAGMASGGYPESGNYGSTFPSQQMNQPSSAPRVPPGGMYQGRPPYY